MHGGLKITPEFIARFFSHKAQQENKEEEEEATVTSEQYMEVIFNTNYRFLNYFKGSSNLSK